MTTDFLKKLQYPIGEFSYSGTPDAEQIRQWIDTIESLPDRLAGVVTPLTAARLDTPYRPGGWTVRQVVHHLGDSHINCYIRFKWTLTEDQPVIKAYDEKRWALLPDYNALPVALSLSFLEMLHRRWVVLLRALTDADLKRSFVHPETGAANRLDKTIGLYAWH